jgi:peroxiredoxin
MKAWKQSLDPNKSSKIRFLGDPSGTFMRALDTEFDSAKVFGQNRSKRYVVKMEDGVVKEVFIEPDNTGVIGKITDCPSSDFPNDILLLQPTIMRIYQLTRPDLVSAAEKVLG